MDEHFVVQCVGKSEEVVAIEEVVVVEVVDDLVNEEFFGVRVHSGRSHNDFGYRNKKQSRRLIGITSVV